MANTKEELKALQETIEQQQEHEEPAGALQETENATEPPTEQQETIEAQQADTDEQPNGDPEEKELLDNLLRSETIRDEAISFDPETGDLTEESREKMNRAIDLYFSELLKRNAILTRFSEIFVDSAAYKNFKEESERRKEVMKKVAENTAARRLKEDNEKRQAAIEEMGLSVAERVLKTTADNSKKLADVIIKLTGARFIDDLKELFESLLNDLPAYKAFLKDFRDNEEQLKEELNKPEYEGNTFEKVMKTYTLGELNDLYNDPESFLYKAFTAIKERAQIIEKQEEGRQRRRQLKENAMQKNAIMGIEGGKFVTFSAKHLEGAFDPRRICKMGNLAPDLIDKETGIVKTTQFKENDILDIKASDISTTAFWIISSLLANSVDNIYENPIRSITDTGEITFYVPGVLKNITTDPRTLLDNQLDIDRKTAGVIYLENLFLPLQDYLGTTPNGSRWKILNYKGYDADSDTMIIETPYIFQLLQFTQNDYFERLERKEKAIKEGKKPKKADQKPLEINRLFKKEALRENETILEIALYITNTILRAGNKGSKPKTTKISYRTIINNCPRLKERLQEIESRPRIDENGNKVNISAQYNSELRKIARAIDLILDPEKCDLLNKYFILDIQPAKRIKKGKEIIFKPKAPTKRDIEDNIIIKWNKKEDENEPIKE